MPWACGHCRAEVDDDQEICWQCGAGSDGTPSPPGWRSELEPAPTPAERELACLRCEVPMRYLGRRKFHEGSYFADAVLGDLFVNREAFDVYACPACSKIEFFGFRPAP